MSGGASFNHPSPDPVEQLKAHIRLMLTYAEDRPARVGLIQSILKKNQEYALPHDLPKDLILEAKVRTAKNSRQTTSAAPIQVSSDNSSVPIPLGVHSLVNPSNALRSATLRMEKDVGNIISDVEFQTLGNHVAHLHDRTLQNNNDDRSLITPGQSTRWSSLFKSHVAGSRELEHCMQPSADPTVHVEFDDMDTSAAKLTWGNALVGYFIGNNPPFFAIKSSLEKAWRITDLEIITMSEGFYLFKFNNYDAGQTILDDGPWFVHGHPLILRRWTEDIEMNRQTFETIPIWVRFPNLNFCFRTSTALSKIASVIGKPICMDHATAAGTRFAFARVCIEVGIDAEFPAEIRIKYKEKMLVQKVEYAWKPNPCKTCHTFDHGEKACPKTTFASKPKQIWVPKKNTSEAVLNATSNEPLQGTSNDMPGKWTVVKDKSPNDKVISAQPNLNRPASPKKIGADSVVISESPNRFSSLSNLDGDSHVSVEDLEETTALVLGNVAADNERHNPGMMSLSSIHQLDKTFISKMAASSSSAKPKIASTGIVIKEKGNKKRSS